MAQPGKNIYDEVVSVIRRDIPGFRIAYKDEVWHQRLLGKLLFFNSNYMENFVSTFGYTVYFPSRAYVEKSYRRAAEILAHEYVHLFDRKSLPVVFELAYLTPQIFVVLAVLTYFSLWFLSALVFLLPWPAYFRSILEMRGYRMGLCIKYWEERTISRDYRNRVAEKFYGSGYYFMWPFRKNLTTWLNFVEDGIRGNWNHGFIWDSSVPYDRMKPIFTSLDDSDE